MRTTLKYIIIFLTLTQTFSVPLFGQDNSDTNRIYVNFISKQKQDIYMIYVDGGGENVFSSSIPIPSFGYWWLRCDPVKPVRLTVDYFTGFMSNVEFYKGDSILADFDKRTWTVINRKNK